MKQKIQIKRSSASKRGNKSFSINQDPFFESEPKRRRKIDYEDDEIASEESDEEENGFPVAGDGGEDAKGEEDDEFADETADEKRKRLAEETLRRFREAKQREMEEKEDDDDDDEDDKEGDRDSLVAKTLMQEQLEDSGRMRRVLASRVQEPGTADEFRLIVKYRQSVTAVALSDDDSRGFSASKDGTIMHWDVSSGKIDKYRWPTEDVLKSHGVKNVEGRTRKHSRQTLALAVSSDGRYLATGGLDRHIHLWDSRTLNHIKAFPGHRGAVSSLRFRLGTAELFSGSFDRTIKLWNVEDRTYITTLFGHQNEVLTIDCQRKERVLSVGRDRTMQLYKVPEESRLIFRAPASSLESCCFISNDEFLSGSDDGSIQLWSMLRKKPVYIVKNAHPILDDHLGVESVDREIATNGHLENDYPDRTNCKSSLASSWVSSVAHCRGSDLAASGAGNGSVRLWGVESESKAIRPLYDLPLSGFVNSLAFSKSGKFLVAGVGREPRLGRWSKIPSGDARDGVAIHPISLS